MGIVGGAFGGADPDAELRATLQEAKGWLEGAIGSWEDLADERKLEMIAASLLSMHRLHINLDSRLGRPLVPDYLISSSDHPAPERPSLVGLEVNRTNGSSAARVELRFRDRALLGETEVEAGTTTDHAAPVRATLEALQPVVASSLELEDARVLQILDGPFAVVTLRNDERLLVGSAMIEDDLGIAMARATLDAANRFIDADAQRKRTIALG